jgi:3-isopropylmalate/(R)-2-methylmalate dehydratase small subunit
VAAQFTTLTAVAAPYEPVNVDTDQIIPARFLKVQRGKDYGRLLFHDLRFGEDGAEKPGFVLNRAPYRDARIFVANANFGCGSSREAAAYAFYDQGFRSVIAPSFGDIFFSNCFQNGVLPIRLPVEQVRALAALAEGGAVFTVDLLRKLVIAPDGSSWSFEVEALPRESLLEGLDDIGLTLKHMDAIDAWERADSTARPWNWVSG